MQKREIVEKAYDEQRIHFESLVKDLQAQISQKDEQIENVRQSSEEEKARIEQEFKTERSRIENEMQSIVAECESTLVKKDEENKSVQEQFKTVRY
jgi:peptidoglycan hydrolase CwlO-like protein